MAEDQTQGKRFSLQSGGRLGAIIGNQGATQTQGSTQSTGASDTSGVQSSGVFLPGISGVNNKVAPTNDFASGIQSGKIQSNIQLPGITTKPATIGTADYGLVEGQEKFKEAEQRERAEQIQLDFIDAGERNKQYGEQVNSEIGTQFEQGARQWWNNVKKAGKGAQSFLLERMANVGYTNGAFGSYGSENAKSKRDERINDARNSNLEYKKKINEGFKKWQKENVNQDLVKEYNGRTFSELITRGDMAGVKYKTIGLFADNISLLPNIIVTAINTPAGLTLIGSDTFIQESQNGFDEMIENGATYEEARNGAMWIGALNAGIEIAGEELFGIVGPASRGLRRLFMKNAVKEIEKNVTKKTLPEIILRAGGAQLKSALGEGGEEVLQEIVTNAFVNTVNKDRSLLDNLWQSFEGGAVMGLLIPGGALNSVTTDVQNNKIIDQKTDLEALDYVLEGEKRKAQRIEQQKEKMRQRANEKFQAQAGENAGLSDTNDYTEGRNVGGSKASSEMATEKTVNTLDAEETISDVSSHSDSSSSDSFFSTDENGDYIVYDDGNGEQKIYAGSNRFIRDGVEKSQFTELSDKTPYDPELEEYSKNFQRLVEKLSDPNVKGQDFVVIGRTEKGKEVRLSKQALKHIIEDHGKINVNTLLKAINKPSKQRWETKTDGKNRPYIVLDLGSKNKEFLVGLAPDSWTKNEDTAEYYTVTTSREAGAPKAPARDTRFQLKYEEEGYTPGVAGKNEKNISGKEGVNLRNKLNKKTVKELAEKYGIKVEVIEGMIEILEKGKRKGYAYGKYIDQLLTLSEQIKESTAPHELLHAIFDMIDPETKTYLISQVMKSEGWSASKAEERLADSFSNFFRTGKIEGAPKSTWGKIKIFFKRVRSFINGMGKWRNQLEGIFTDIIESEGIEDLQGKIDRNERINKAKERMRERFKQYQKNAEKMQKKADKSKEKYQTVYHGSPYDFDKFDSANMGKGEGAQAHGWGHYVAVNERTGRHYAEMRGNGEWSYKGKTRTEIRDMVGLETPEEKQALRTMARMEEWGWSFDKAKNDQIKDYKEYIDKLNERIDRVKKGDHSIYDTVEQAQDELKKAKNELKILESLSESDFKKTTRNLYEVEIPDPVKANTPTGSNYLEEGKKPTRNQYEKFKNELEKYVKNYMPSRIVNLLDVKYEDLNGWGKANVGGGGGALYDIAGTVLGGDKQASKFLESLGYDGIHYFGGRDGEAYVIFNDDALEIKNHEKYQKADIDPETTSPEDLIEVNDKGLDVMVKFVSEKQKKNALDVSKELLTTDGKPYMWTSTNKYKSKVITDWRNVEDSKYKEYTDKGIQVARFTNNSSMSYSYADYKSKLAPVKKFKSIDELNKFFKENPNNYERILGNGIDDGVLKSSVVYEMKENDGKFELISNSTETLTQSMKDFYDGINNDWFGGNIGEMPENKDEALKKLQEYYNEHDYEIDGERTVKLLKNGNVERTVVKEPTVYKRFDTKLDALAEGYTIAQEADLYHYQGVIQKMKNPLVVDIRSKDNTPSTWSRLGTVNDIFDKEGINYNKEVDYYIRDVEEAMDGFSERMKALEQYWNDAYRDDPYGEVSQFMGNVQLSANNGVTYMVDELEDLLNDPAMGEDLKIGLDTEVYGDLRDYGRTLRDVIIELRNFINTDRNYYALKKLSPEGIESWVKDMGAPKEVVKMIKNKNWKDMLGNWRDIGDKGWRENIKELLTTNGMDLETNDWVRYALDSGKYDGVIFKNIIDYGGLPKEGWENAKGGDVAVTFRSNQFKTWDNEDPTDSKYIRYQRVYHGSPAEFDKFDSSHMGEGEGDQVHGRGHYVAVDPKTGKEYAETLAGPRYKGKEMYELASDLPGYQWNVINHVAEQMRDGVDIENAIANDKKWHEYLLNKAEENLKTEKDEDNIDYLEREIKQQKEMIKIADGLKVSDFETSRGRRNFYEVEIPDIVDADTPTGTNYFEENKVLTRSEIEKILNKLLKRKTQGSERVKNAIDYDLKDGEKIDGRAMVFNLRAGLGNKKASKFLESLGYDGIHYFGGKDGEAYVIFNDDNLEIKNHEKYQKVEYEYDENGNPKRIKFGDNSEFDPSIFGENTKEEQIEEDKENEKGNPFYNAWMRYNNQNYKDDQKTFEEFMKGLSDRADKEQEIYDEKMKSLSDAQNDPKLLELQLKAIKLMEKEQNVGKKFGKNVSKEVRDRQQAEVEKERENLVKEIFDYMYPGLKFEDATYEDNQSAFEKEAEWEMLGKEDIENKLKLYKKDKNGNREAKEIKIDNPDIKLEKLLSAGKFDEIFEPTDRVIEWKTPEGQKGRIDKAKDPKKFKSVMEKINSGKTKTKVELKDVTQEARAYEKQKAMEEAEKERKKKEQQEAKAKKKQEEYKKMVRMKAFQRLVDMQRFEKYPFLTEEEIKNRYGFTDQEWKTITEQEEIKLPKKRGEKAISDFNKAVYDQVRAIRDGLERQNKMKMKDAEKNLGEIGEIDLDVLLGKDEEKGQKEVEEFEKLAKEGKEETGGEKIEEGKTAWEKDMDKKNEKAKKQAEKLTKKWKEDVNDMFRKAEEKRNERYANKEEKVIDEVKTVEEAKEITKESRWKRTKKFWKDTTIQDLIQPISSRIEKISPRIYLELMRFEQRVAVKTNTRMKQVEDFVKKMAEIRSKNKKDYLNITLHLLNGNVGTANKMLEKYGTSIPRQVLDEIWADAEDVGYTMNYEGFYYPRKVKDVKDFLDRYAKTENANIQGKIDKIVKKKKEEAQKRGEQFTDEDKANLINQLLMEGEVEGISLGSGHMKERKIDSITKNMLEFYEDPVDALLQYITSMTEAVEKARFLGQGKKGEIKSIGEFIADEGITGSDVDELEKLLLSRFNYAPMGDFMRGLKVSANIIHLGSPSSALSQLADISFSLIENGLTNLVQGLTNRYNLDLDALGITNRGEELKTQGKNETKREKVQRFTFKLTGFNMMDQFGKKSFVVSTLNKLIKYAKRNDPQLRKDLERWFDDPKMINEIIEDLKEGRMSENVNLFLFTKLADVQPLTRTQMPKTYLQAGNWRVLYAFKTFGIKQLDYLIQKSKRELATKPTAKALWTITAMLGIIMLCGAGTDEIKDFTLGRKSSSWIWRMIEGNDWSVSQMSDRFWDNLLKLVGITKYSIYQARTQGIKSTIEDIFFSLPGLDIVTYPLQDIQEAMSEDGLDFSQASSWQLLPIVGKYGYWWAGAGQTKQQKALEKEKKKGSKNKGKIKL